MGILKPPYGHLALRGSQDAQCKVLFYFNCFTEITCSNCCRSLAFMHQQFTYKNMYSNCQLLQKYANKKQISLRWESWSTLIWYSYQAYLGYKLIGHRKVISLSRFIYFMQLCYPGKLWNLKIRKFCRKKPCICLINKVQQ